MPGVVSCLTDFGVFNRVFNRSQSSYIGLSGLPYSRVVKPCVPGGLPSPRRRCSLRCGVIHRVGMKPVMAASAVAPVAVPYLDCNGTTPVYDEVRAAMLPCFDASGFGNPSSGHVYGANAKRKVDNARSQVASLLECDANDVVFTSCGTEADTHAIWGAAFRAKGAFHVDMPHVVATTAEHPAVIETLKMYEQLGILKYTLAPVTSEGNADPATVAECITTSTCLVTCMHANNEVGALTDIAAVSRACRQRAEEMKLPEGQLLIHTDAAQSVGKVPVSVKAMGVDMLTVVGHKFGAPKGIAALVVVGDELHEGPKRLVPLLSGGSQERGARAGTENVPYIVGLGEAARIATEELDDYMNRTERIRSIMLADLQAACSSRGIDMIVHGPSPSDRRLPNTLSVALLGVDAKPMLSAVGADGVAASGGAACHSGTGSVSGSHVLVAMGHGGANDVLRGTMRLSVGRLTTEDEARRGVQVLVDQLASTGSS